MTPALVETLAGCPCRGRIVLTGGPGGGKTTAADLFRRELRERVVLVPEAATLLFSGGFPRSRAPAGLRATQAAIYGVQRALEDVQAAAYPEKLLLCDRGTVDGAAYWPGGPEGFFQALGSSLDAELARYDAVVFFESAAIGGHEVGGNNPTRVESTSEAADLDARLRALWSRHPRFALVRNHASFIQKIGVGLEAILAAVQAINGSPPR